MEQGLSIVQSSPIRVYVQELVHHNEITEHPTVGYLGVDLSDLGNTPAVQQGHDARSWVRQGRKTGTFKSSVCLQTGIRVWQRRLMVMEVRTDNILGEDSRGIRKRAETGTGPSAKGWILELDHEKYTGAAEWTVESLRSKYSICNI